MLTTIFDDFLEGISVARSPKCSALLDTDTDTDDQSRILGLNSGSWSR